MKIKLSLLLFLLSFLLAPQILLAQDFDDDGVEDILDQDDDNDGILDLKEGAVCFSAPRLLPNAVATATATGSGATGIPTLSYEVPNGVDRLLLVYITVERDHTIAPYGDNWESNWPLTGVQSDRQTIDFGSATMTLERLRFTYNYFDTPANPIPNIPANAEHSSTSYIYSLSEGDIPGGINAFDFSEFILPTNAGDEFSVIVSAYEGVNALEFVAVDSFFESTTPTWSISGDALSPNQDTGTTPDQNLLLAYGAVGTDSGITASASWTSISNVSLPNANGTYISDLASGGTPATEDDGISTSLYSLSGVTGNQTITFSTSFPSTFVFNKHVFLHRLIGYAIDDDDNDGLANCVDIDSDADGIPDNIEAQPTIGYIPPNNVIDQNTGIDSAYATAIGLEDTDIDGIPDFIDADSDNDGTLDIEENGDVNTLNNNDTDTDGLDNNFDSNNVTYDANDEVTTGTPAELTTVFGDVDSDLLIGGDLDYRDFFDVNPPASATIDFDGIDDYVEVPNSVINGLSEFTISFWFKYEGPVITGADEVFVLGQKDAFEVYLGEWQPTTPQYQDVNVRLNGAAGTGWRFTSSDWTNFTVTVSFDGSDTSYKIYRNGFSSPGSATLSGAVNTNTNPFRLGITNGTTTFDNYEGWMDEVKIFNTALTDDQVQRMVFQEIENNGGNVKGSVINKDIVDISTNTTIPWADLISYYPMSNIVDSKIIDESFYTNDATLYNITTILPQTAPLPFETVQDGAWSEESTWLHGDVWDIESLPSFDPASQSPEPWSIVQIHDNITTNTSHRSLGMFIDSDKSLTVTGDNSINNTWYLELNGTIDLLDDSQLIQSENSDLVTSADGKILRRQEGNSNVYWYNYWSSPVGALNATTLSDNNSSSNNDNNTPFSLGMLKQGIDGANVQFTSAMSPPLTNPVTISSRWFFTFQNGLTYNNWVQIDQNSAVAPGLGYTQKGTGVATSEQQYILEGKPNNGTILVAADDVDGDSTNESQQDVTLTTVLVGNPYPSAIDARQFIADNAGTIQDNTPIMQGTILLWEQWAGNTHNLAEYEGGYGYINTMTTERAYQYPGIPIAGQTQPNGIKTPSFYIPVGQGFFVEVINDGNIEFNNGQRVFIKEADANENDPEDGSVFFEPIRPGDDINTDEDKPGELTQQKDAQDNNDNILQLIRLEFSASNGASRRFVLGFDAHTTDDFDYGYDGGLISDLPEEDMASSFNNKPYVLQGFSEITAEKVIDLSLNVSGNYSYSLDMVEHINIDDTQGIYVRDNQEDVTWDLREGPYNFSANAGADSNRFDIVFEPGDSLSNEEFDTNNILIYVNNPLDKLYIKGLQENVTSLSLTSILGQRISYFKNPEIGRLENGIDISSLAAGVYLVNLILDNATQITKKVIVQ